MEYYGIERARKTFVEHSDVPTHVANEEWRRSMWNFVMGTQLHVGAIMSVGQAALICFGFGPPDVAPITAGFISAGYLATRYVICLLYTSPSPRDRG